MDSPGERILADRLRLPGDGLPLTALAHSALSAMAGGGERPASRTAGGLAKAEGTRLLGSFLVTTYMYTVEPSYK
eukprot:5221436-Prymnesium_polylepis.1